MKHVKSIICFFLIGTGCTLYSQSYKEDVLTIYKNMRNAANYSMELEYNLYVDKNLSSPFQVRTIEVKREGTNLYMKQNNGIEVLDNFKHQVFVDNIHKSMSVTKKNSSENNPETLNTINNYFQTQIDTFLMVFQKINILSNNHERVKYECVYKNNPDAVKMIVTVNKKSKMFESVITEYKTPTDIPELDNKKHTVTVEVKYKKFVANTAFNKSIFNSENFVVSGQQGKLKPVSKYSNYKFISPN